MLSGVLGLGAGALSVGALGAGVLSAGFVSLGVFCGGVVCVLSSAAYTECAGRVVNSIIAVAYTIIF
ncbi:MAG: hypothetical protein K2O40_11230 [Lachnospiraceae bacterium]|nr:hypothetical protein [Lachnospiraceae bacterium]